MKIMFESVREVIESWKRLSCDEREWIMNMTDTQLESVVAIGRQKLKKPYSDEDLPF